MKLSESMILRLTIHMDIHLKKRKKLSISLSVDLGEYIHFLVQTTSFLISELVGLGWRYFRSYWDIFILCSPISLYVTGCQVVFCFHKLATTAYSWDHKTVNAPHFKFTKLWGMELIPPPLGLTQRNHFSTTSNIWCNASNTSHTHAPSYAHTIYIKRLERHQEAPFRM